MFVKFLLAIYVAGTFGHTVGNQLYHDYPTLHFPDSNHDNSMPSEWHDFVSIVCRKIEGMERLLAEKDERIDQMELNMASQMTEIKKLKLGMTSLEQASTLKDKLVDKLSKRILDLENIVTDSKSRKHFTSPHLRNEKNSAHFELEHTLDSTPGSSIVKIATPEQTSKTSMNQNTSVIPNQADEDDTSEKYQKESRDLSISNFSRFKPKRVAPNIRITTAFHAVMSSSKAVTPNEALVFDQETLDQGEGYNPGTGLYTVPESGTYVLTWTIVCNPHNAIQTVLVVNGAIRGSSWTDSQEINDYHQTSALVVLTLNEGDHIYIRMGHTYGKGTVVSSGTLGRPTFSGWKLG
ncbi:EMILIN-2-like [Pecten maximus]|uniref:EMILIN-2-like n=1 Tax=Pecten maximus TaxID=6579 RepID=UPI001457F0E4|nr:EMILIN-2-like [Pecten maximus]